ncbi:DUF726 domain-containing protein [Pseudoalteromonas sp. JC28]|uniref:DUF726 domain-containing protein n=1 Tax=Pseudoalteromonas sp. JC28 TaxID=2267617 RepID=UPI001574CEA7|nr:DUF726 domain-containing protein [Pseudoalteromonas sp. JC28]
MKTTVIRDGIEPTIVLVNGFLSELETDVSDWLEIIDILYPKNRVEHCRWNSGSFKTIGKKVVIENLAKLLLLPQAKISLLHSTYAICKEIITAWSKALEVATETGIHLAKYINQQNRSFVLFGHSLGAKVIYSALDCLERQQSVSKAFLFGGAIANNEPWTDIYLKHPELMIFNHFSEQDEVLKRLYKLATTFSHEPVGLKGIENSQLSLIYNIDLSHVVTGHSDYKNHKIGKILFERNKLASKYNLGSSLVGRKWSYSALALSTLVSSLTGFLRR